MEVPYHEAVKPIGAIKLGRELDLLPLEGDTRNLESRNLKLAETLAKYMNGFKILTCD